MNTGNLHTLEVDDKLSLIQNLINSYDYDVAVKECCTVFEIVFRKIFQQAMVSLPFNERQIIIETEQKIGKGNKGVENFTFGELVGLIREVKLLDKWSKHLSKDMGLIKTLDYSSIVNLRNRITHNGATCSRAEANIVYEYLKNLLAVLGFADLDNSINQSFSRNNSTKLPNDTQEKQIKQLNEKLPKIRKTVKSKSVYSSSAGNEKQRLETQGNNIRKFDLKAFKQAFDTFEQKTDLIALDMGCAGGYVTYDRFKEYDDHLAKVIGVDINEVKINDANNQNYGDKYSFHCLDIENPSFDSDIKSVLQEQTGTDKVDIIFSSLTIHHLANPLKALIKLRKLLKKDGVIILRGSDDGSKLAYPDEQALVESLIKLTLEVQGVSDRENGRKLYNQLKKSGFRGIDMLYNIKDTSNMGPEERYNLFEESFSYRINYFKRQLDSDPTNENYIEEYEWVSDALEELEVEFLDDSFFYMEMDYIAIAKK